MELERLVAALAPEAVLGSPDPVEVRDLAYDARAVTPGAAFFCVPGSAPTVTTSPRRRWRAAPSPSSSSGPSSPRYPSSSSRLAGGDGDRGGRLLRRADPRARGRGRDRDEREDDHGVPALLGARGGRPAAGAARHGREPRRRRGASGRAHDPGGDRPAAHLSRDAGRGQPERRARGVLARAPCCTGSTGSASTRSSSRT